MIRTFFYILIGAALTTFIYANYDQRVVVYFDFTRRYHTEELPLSHALAGAMAVGFLVAGLVAIGDQIRLRGRIRQLKRGSEKLEAELGALRNLPLGETLPAPATPAEERKAPLGPAH